MDLFQQQMNRKDEHVGHANQQYRATSAPEFVETRFVHHPFTTVDVADVTLQTKLAGLTFDVPFFINAITGGSPLTTALNQRLAILAHETGMAMATGSMSIAMKFPENAESFKVIRQEIQMESSSRTLVRITMLRLLNALSNSSKPTRFKFTSTVHKNS